jgi:hypothetical protein
MESAGSAPIGRTTRVLALPAPAPLDQQQRDADDDERDTEERYRRYQAFVELVADAVRRAEVMTRLERALSLQPD